MPHSCVPDLTSSDFDLQPVNKIFCRFSNRQIFRGRYYYYYYFKLFYFLRSCPYNFNKRPNYRILPSILSNTCPFCVLFNRENISWAVILSLLIFSVSKFSSILASLARIIYSGPCVFSLMRICPEADNDLRRSDFKILSFDFSWCWDPLNIWASRKSRHFPSFLPCWLGLMFLSEESIPRSDSLKDVSVRSPRKLIRELIHTVVQYTINTNDGSSSSSNRGGISSWDSSRSCRWDGGR